MYLINRQDHQSATRRSRLNVDNVFTGECVLHSDQASTLHCKIQHLLFTTALCTAMWTRVHETAANVCYRQTCFALPVVAVLWSDSRQETAPWAENQVSARQTYRGVPLLKLILYFCALHTTEIHCIVLTQSDLQTPQCILFITGKVTPNNRFIWTCAALKRRLQLTGWKSASACAPTCTK